MGIINRLKTAYYQLTGKKAVKRKQFNLTIDEDIILAVKSIAAILEVPMYVACEHLLQVGCQHLLQDLSEPELREQLKEHLIESHLLGKELKGEEEILNLG